MWLAGGAAVVVAAVMLVVLAFLEDDRRASRPVRYGAVTPEELRSAQLPVAWRGYDRGHVDALLARSAATLEDVRRYGTLDPGGPADPERPARAAGPPPSFLADTLAPRDEATASDAGLGEELEDRGGDDAGRLDR